jgi:aspartate/methionine/tyrosine aminotransferase
MPRPPSQPAPSPLVDALRPAAAALPESGIVRVAVAARAKKGVVPLYVGEGDLPTPAFICEAANKSLQAGETFYTYQRGIPELRQALAAHHARLYGKPFDSERFLVTGSGMQAIMLAVQAIVGKGNEIVLASPAWPNITAAMEVVEARPVPVPVRLGNKGWQLDLERLLKACTKHTRAIFLNSPANPTGWTASREELAHVLAFARERGIWIIADEVYGRFYYPASRAPSFYDIAAPEDRIIMVNTFSKNWAMTGWRVGWMNVPVEIGQVVENLIQYNTSGVAAFMQRAAVVALEEGEGFVAEQVARARAGRDLVTAALRKTGRTRFAEPEGAFYLFFAVEGFEDSMALALRLVEEARVGLAPGIAFGRHGEGYLRLCFARSAESLGEAAERLCGWLERQ